jgi:hypothetical protein
MKWECKRFLSINCDTTSKNEHEFEMDESYETWIAAINVILPYGYWLTKKQIKKI